MLILANPGAVAMLGRESKGHRGVKGTHLEVPPDNSLCERLARVFKRKQRQAIAFRSFGSLCGTLDSISAVYNMRLAGKDVIAEVASVFYRPMPSAAG